MIISSSVEPGLEDNIHSFEDSMKVPKDNRTTEQTSITDNNDNKNFITDKYPCDNKQFSKSDSLEAGVTSSPETLSWLDSLKLDQLSWVGTLGIGGFGRVELVTAGENNNMAFALKKMKKIEVSFVSLTFTTEIIAVFE